MMTGVETYNPVSTSFFRCVVPFSAFCQHSALRIYPADLTARRLKTTSKTNRRLIVGPAVTTLGVHRGVLMLLRPVSIQQLGVFKGCPTSFLCFRVSPRNQRGQMCRHFSCARVAMTTACEPELGGMVRSMSDLRRSFCAAALRVADNKRALSASPGRTTAVPGVESFTRRNG